MTDIDEKNTVCEFGSNEIKLCTTSTYATFGANTFASVTAV
jgi:hypothetical protein